MIEREVPVNFLWACTFISPGDSYLDRYYSTYIITSSGLWSGLVIPPHSEGFWYYRIIDEFSSIAFQLITLGLFDRHRDMWYDSLDAALLSARKDL